ncbi:MAG TPA: neutral zinc metallopeptidase [Gemmatimonadaceae bacterium]|nr:neutral zinc metallopeptidase [Gemmatimonadaceae bacterium]
MNHNSSYVRSRIAAAALFIASVVAPVSRSFAAEVVPAPSARPIQVTAQDVAASNKKISMAYSALLSMWTNDFRQIGERFDSPRIARYRSSAYTACGVIRPNNAQYCPEANTIYYDEVFVAGMAKLAATSLGTDGDMTAVGIIAHEMGHAVAIQLGHESRSSYANESTADCLAGAFAQQAQRDGELEKGDVDEAFYGMSLAGDPTPQLTGNERYDSMIQARLARESHGTKEQRMQNFRGGLDGGAKACLDEFGGLK